jgi:hypothetical protein
MSEHTNKKLASIDRIIEDEWDILLDLKDTLKNHELSAADRLRAANAYAYHASVISKLLARKGTEAHVDETTLGDFIKTVEPRTAAARRVTLRRRRGIIQWMKRHSRKR